MGAPLRTSFPKDQIRVLLLEKVAPSAVEAFGAEGFQVEAVASALGEDELRARIGEAHLLVVRSRTFVTPAVLAEARRLLAVGTFCIGTDQVALGEANARGVPVFNAPFSSTRSVAELVIGEIIMLARQLGDRSAEVHRGQWRKVATGSREVRGKTIGLVGYGHIGTQVGILAEAIGLRVLFHDIVAKLPLGNARPCAGLGELLAQSDFVSLHVPDLPSTRDLIGAREIGAMKRGAFLLNASRGLVANLPALASALRSCHLAGAAVDVFPVEPQGAVDDFELELRGLPNVIMTPHIGGSTEEAQAAIGREVATSLIKFVNEGATTGAVNFPAVELPPAPGTHRILNVHRNVPGVLREINRIVSDLGANIRAQLLSTDPHIGYLIMDLDEDVSHEVMSAVAALPTNIRTRILY